MTDLVSRPVETPGPTYGERPAWVVGRPRLSRRSLILGWVLAAAGLLIAAALLPGIEIDSASGALGVAAVVGILNAFLAPAIAAIRLPFTVVSGFVLVLLLDAAILSMASGLFSD